MVRRRTISRRSEYGAVRCKCADVGNFGDGKQNNFTG